MSNLPPSGEIPRGAIRFNIDSNKPELWDGSQWAEFQLSTPNLGQGSDTQPGARGVWAGGLNPSGGGYQDVIDYGNIASTGNAIDFGNLTLSRGMLAAVASNSRGVFMGGYAGTPRKDTMDFITFASTGDATDFGDLIAGTSRAAAVSNQTRGVIGGGDTDSPGTGGVTTINYITIASTSGSIDFGELNTIAKVHTSASSPVRGVFAGGQNPALQSLIQFITIPTLGNAEVFGDLSANRNGYSQGASNPIRGLFFGGAEPGNVNTIEYVTFSTTGDAVNFGDLTAATDTPAGCSNSVRAVTGGGVVGPARVNTMNMVTIMTEGDAVDFGDLTVARNNLTATSNAHGGL